MREFIQIGAGLIALAKIFDGIVTPVYAAMNWQTLHLAPLPVTAFGPVMGAMVTALLCGVVAYVAPTFFPKETRH